MKFSERLGYTSVKKELAFEEIDDDLRNTMYSYFLDGFIKTLQQRELGGERPLYEYCYSLWLHFFKLPIDTAPIHSDRSASRNNLINKIRQVFYSDSSEWYEIYDLIEYSVPFGSNSYTKTFNEIFEREKIRL